MHLIALYLRAKADPSRPLVPRTLVFGASRMVQRIGRANHRLDEPSRALFVPALVHDVGDRVWWPSKLARRASRR